MGGFGSGRKWGKPYTSSMYSVDVRQMKRQGVLRPGFAGVLGSMSRAGLDTQIGFRVLDDRVRFSYRNKVQGGSWIDVGVEAILSRTACHLGGERTWWLCPNCRQRVAILYMGRMIACRRCWGLAYRSERETDTDRAFRRANSLRERLGWVPGVAFGIGDKPKGMHWRTYRRLCKRYEVELRGVVGYAHQVVDQIEDRLRRVCR